MGGCEGKVRARAPWEGGGGGASHENDCVAPHATAMSHEFDVQLEVNTKT